MERNGFNSSKFETSDSESGGSTETSKTTKTKKTAESKKKESFADRFKASIGEKLIEEKQAKPEKKNNQEKIENSENIEKKKDPEGQSNTDESGIESGLEEATLTSEENVEVDERLKIAKAEELRSEIDTSDDEVEIVASQAALEALEDLSASELIVEAEEVESTEESQQTAEHQEVLFADEDEPLPFDDEPIALSGTAGGSRSGGMSPPGRSSGSGTSGSGTSPPPRATPLSPPPPPFRGPNLNTYNPAAPNVAPAARAEYQPDYGVNPNATYLLVGGVVGYLIGRRRGRIKTEKRMNVVVKKLEKQVEAKQQIINEHVETAKQQARQEYWASKGRPAAVAETAKPEKPAETLNYSAVAIERPAGTERLVANRERAVETERKKLELQTEQPEKLELREEDILRISETVKIGETNLKKIHEAKLITDGGLRRLVNEHLQGKDIRRGLAREFLTKELSYERDPRFRDIVPLEAKGKGARPQTGGGATAPVLAQPVSLQADDHTASPAMASVSDVPPAKPRRTAVSTSVLSVLSLIALALAIYAVWLGMSR
jgi:hypothetical protein